ncbi:MAG: TolC family protein [Acidobacteria bacterium]|nr:MAG: TolC family protein [Acidobacteriota bacterium]PYY24385.1 MAG: TolC family protein [Acidobacteriota bacterium]
MGCALRIFQAICLTTAFCGPAMGQQTGTPNAQPQASAPDSQAPVVLTLRDALERARNLDPTYRTALTAAGIAQEDHVQARAALLPSVAENTEYLYTQGGTGTSTPRYIANNAVHEYVSQGNIHQVISGAQFADFNRTSAAAAAARANAEIASRGLVATVVTAYYAEVVARRKYANAQLAADETKRFFELTQKLEQGGEVAHSDVIKAQLTANDAQRAQREAELAMGRTHLELAVLVFQSFNQNFSTVDDLRLAPPLPPMQELEQQAKVKNPQLYAAMQSFRAAGYEVLASKAAYLPSLSLDYFYGIDANRFATYSNTPEGRIRNLGYSAIATLNIPIWNWGAIHSKVRQSELRREQVQIELSAAQRKLIAGLRTLYAEADAARIQLDVLQQSADLAAQSVQLTLLRYQGGEATALEVVDAQNALVTARNNFDDGQSRYRVAIANLQTLTGVF